MEIYESKRRANQYKRRVNQYKMNVIPITVPPEIRVQIFLYQKEFYKNVVAALNVASKIDFI